MTARRRLLLIVLIGVITACTSAARAVDRRDKLGATVADAPYRFRHDTDLLDEESDQLLAVGSRVIKLYLDVAPCERPSAKMYQLADDSARAKTLVELASSPAYRRLFAKPFTTFVLTTFSAGHRAGYWVHHFTEADAADETRQFAELTRYLMTTYAGSGKTFVLSHWEGDWAVRGNFDRKRDPDPVAMANMVRWLNARQAGVDTARQAMHVKGVHVYHAAEVNLLRIALLDHRPTVTDQVLPHTHVDLVSYSAWDTQEDPALFGRALQYIADHAPHDGPLGEHNVYIGEFGCAENQHPLPHVQATIRNVVDTAMQFGCPYVIYWAVYSNETLHTPAKTNNDVRGLWLIRPDGTKAWAWHYLHDQIAP